MEMREICREYAESKKKCRNGKLEAPVWKFSDTDTLDYYEQLDEPPQ
jgi:hypothetical protein